MFAVTVKISLALRWAQIQPLSPVSRHQQDDAVLDLVILDVDSSGGLDEKSLAIRIKALGPKPP
jgi:hypothetical protein